MVYFSSSPKIQSVCASVCVLKALWVFAIINVEVVLKLQKEKLGLMIFIIFQIGLNFKSKKVFVLFMECCSVQKNSGKRCVQTVFFIHMFPWIRHSQSQPERNLSCGIYSWFTVLRQTVVTHNSCEKWNKPKVRHQITTDWQLHCKLFPILFLSRKPVRPLSKFQNKILMTYKIGSPLAE